MPSTVCVWCGGKSFSSDKSRGKRRCDRLTRFGKVCGGRVYLEGVSGVKHVFRGKPDVGHSPGVVPGGLPGDGGVSVLTPRKGSLERVGVVEGGL